MCVLVTELCPTLCDPVNYSPPGSSVHGTSQARILKWIAICFSRDIPEPGIESEPPALTGRFFTTLVPCGKPHFKLNKIINVLK